MSDKKTSVAPEIEDSVLEIPGISKDQSIFLTTVEGKQMMQTMYQFNSAKNYFFRVACALDVLANVILGGIPGQTISSRVGIQKIKGKKWACVFCKMLDWFNPPNHCEEAIANDTKRSLIQALDTVDEIIFEPKLMITPNYLEHNIETTILISVTDARPGAEWGYAINGKELGLVGKVDINGEFIYNTRVNIKEDVAIFTVYFSDEIVVSESVIVKEPK
jgi:hypothetical protein